MKAAIAPILGLPFILLSFCNSASAQLTPSRYQVVNKSLCKALVRVGCTDNSISQYIIQPNGFADGDCGDNIEVCFIFIDFDDGNTGPERVESNPYIGQCVSLINIPSPKCYSGNLDWAITPSGFITMNFY